MSRVVILAAAWLAAWGVAAEPPQDPRIQVLADPPSIQDFTLTDQDGRAMRFGELRGRNVLVFFGFTSCPKICPAAMFRLKQLAASFEEAGPLPAVVFISVDGDRDTPDVLKRYLAGYSPTFIGMTGDPKSVRKVAAGFKAVFFKGLPYDQAGHYQVDHTSMIYLVDGEGRLRATFLDAPAEAMAATTRSLVATAD